LPQPFGAEAVFLINCAVPECGHGKLTGSRVLPNRWEAAARGWLCVTGKEAICGRSAQGSANTGEEFRLTGTSVGGKELAPVSYYAARDRFQKADLSGATALSARMCGGWSKL